jgi:hypothetical protein
MWRHAAAKSPLGFPAGAIPTVDFLLHHLAPDVKNTPVKTHDRADLTWLVKQRDARNLRKTAAGHKRSCDEG